ncbi:hypothetical protein M413DRAFT_424049 [Hebeloma cylindrosporum]|uniref:Uncharacterized protein n=1 Tax=Hebeloma cylindrosporum TaxID=76867 RepID=A0A0C2XG73_HEBCY|nr:hypothetical protein M413DRAFT_424049 [Hebeloma cylindrosporum h7]
MFWTPSPPHYNSISQNREAFLFYVEAFNFEFQVGGHFKYCLLVTFPGGDIVVEDYPDCGYDYFIGEDGFGYRKQKKWETPLGREYLERYKDELPDDFDDDMPEDFVDDSISDSE